MGGLLFYNAEIAVLRAQIASKDRFGRAKRDDGRTLELPWEDNRPVIRLHTVSM